jgi:uncharacterized DUF497 family protein
MNFVWDERKNQANYRKHGFSFDQARRFSARQLLLIMTTDMTMVKTVGSLLVC